MPHAWKTAATQVSLHGPKQQKGIRSQTAWQHWMSEQPPGDPRCWRQSPASNVHTVGGEGREHACGWLRASLVQKSSQPTVQHCPMVGCEHTVEQQPTSEHPGVDSWLTSQAPALSLQAGKDVVIAEGAAVRCNSAPRSSSGPHSEAR
eukprot:CAMPEP_0115601978 /NCGR_PEP_ID=MMETSP0272-20121206/15676_1 /TAXON_ID=71861 /ORGANISM="Scrippsiella trochoidea, Strain CCMP3099" /LENGTH=147 /DNA_ID=CAMNT_0003037457 /DNA_START=482 /DNA_END=921 /DNA_ORIENTATION=+